MKWRSFDLRSSPPSALGGLNPVSLTAFLLRLKKGWYNQGPYGLGAHVVILLCCQNPHQSHIPWVTQISLLISAGAVTLRGQISLFLLKVNQSHLLWKYWIEGSCWSAQVPKRGPCSECALSSRGGSAQFPVQGFRICHLNCVFLAAFMWLSAALFQSFSMGRTSPRLLKCKYSMNISTAWV